MLTELYMHFVLRLQLLCLITMSATGRPQFDIR